MLEELIKAIRAVINNPNLKEPEEVARAKQNWQNFEEELAKVSEQDLLNCQGLDSKSLPLFVALEAENSKVVQALIKKCPTITSILNDKGQPAIFFVNDYGNIAELLFTHTSKSSVTCRDKDGNNILHLQAGYIGNNQIFEKLCDSYPILADQVNCHKQTPLFQISDTKKAEMLLAKMSEKAICQKSAAGTTVLHQAVLAEEKNLVEMLLASCAKLIYVRNNEEKTALDISKNKGITDILHKTFYSFESISELIAEKEKLENIYTKNQAVIENSIKILAQRKTSDFKNKQIKDYSDNQEKNIPDIAEQTAKKLREQLVKENENLRSIKEEEKIFQHICEILAQRKSIYAIDITKSPSMMENKNYADINDEKTSLLGGAKLDSELENNDG